MTKKSFRREQVIVWLQHCKGLSRQSVRFWKKTCFLDKIFSKKTIIFIFNEVSKDLKVNKASWTSPMTKKAWDADKFNF